MSRYFVSAGGAGLNVNQGLDGRSWTKVHTVWVRTVAEQGLWLKIISPDAEFFFRPKRDRNGPFEVKMGETSEWRGPLMFEQKVLRRNMDVTTNDPSVLGTFRIHSLFISFDR